MKQKCVITFVIDNHSIHINLHKKAEVAIYIIIMNSNHKTTMIHDNDLYILGGRQ